MHPLLFFNLRHWRGKPLPTRVVWLVARAHVFPPDDHCCMYQWDLSEPMTIIDYKDYSVVLRTFDLRAHAAFTSTRDPEFGMCVTSMHVPAAFGLQGVPGMPCVPRVRVFTFIMMWAATAERALRRWARRHKTRRAAAVHIQRAWRVVVACPSHAVCRRRLMREFADLPCL
jgi:hypothetical protein